jgi:hypothetical protein
MATQNNNVILLEKDSSSPLRGTQRTVDAADDIVLAPATVSIAPSGNVAINSSSGTLSMGNSASTQAINIGTAGARIITIGQGVGTGPTIVLDGVTNATQIESNGVLAIGSNYVGAETVYIGSGNLGVFAQTRTINIGNTTSGSGVNLYAGFSSNILLSGPIQLSSAASQITIAATSGSVSIDATTNGAINLGTNGGTGPILIGTAATNRIITLGNATNTSAFTINAGSGGISLSTNATAGTINVGIDNGTGTISIGTGTATRAINIGSGAANGSINIGTSTNAGRTVTVGNTTGTSRIVLTGGSGTAAGSEAIAIGNDAGTGTIAIAGANATGARTVNLGTGGTAAKTVNVGSTASTSSTTIQTGTGAMTFAAGGIYDVNATGAVTIDSSGGTIGIGTDNINQTISIGTSGSRSIRIGNSTATGGTTVTLYVAQRSIEIGTQSGASANAQGGVGYYATNRTANSIVRGEVLAFQVSPTADQARLQMVLASANGTAVTKIPVAVATPGTVGFTANGSEMIATVPGTVVSCKFASGTPTGADIGKPVYLSETDGRATLTAPSASGRTIYLLGHVARGVADADGNWYILWRPQFIADIP